MKKLLGTSKNYIKIGKNDVSKSFRDDVCVRSFFALFIDSHSYLCLYPSHTTVCKAPLSFAGLNLYHPTKIGLVMPLTPSIQPVIIYFLCFSYLIEWAERM